MDKVKDYYKVSLGLLMDEYGYKNQEEIFRHGVNVIEYEYKTEN